MRSSLSRRAQSLASARSQTSSMRRTKVSRALRPRSFHRDQFCANKFSARQETLLRDLPLLGQWPPKSPTKASLQVNLCICLRTELRCWPVFTMSSLPSPRRQSRVPRMSVLIERPPEIVKLRGQADLDRVKTSS